MELEVGREPNLLLTLNTENVICLPTAALLRTLCFRSIMVFIFIPIFSYFTFPFFMWLEQRDCIKAWTPCIILTRSLALLKEGKLEAGIIL